MNPVSTQHSEAQGGAPTSGRCLATSSFQYSILLNLSYQFFISLMGRVTQPTDLLVLLANLECDGNDPTFISLFISTLYVVAFEWF